MQNFLGKGALLIATPPGGLPPIDPHERLAQAFDLTASLEVAWTRQVENLPKPMPLPSSLRSWLKREAGKYHGMQPYT